MATDQRPIVRTLVAKPVYGSLGDVERMDVIAYTKAQYAREAGWLCLDDPADEEAAAKWDREHGATRA